MYIDSNVPKTLSCIQELEKESAKVQCIPPYICIYCMYVDSIIQKTLSCIQEHQIKTTKVQCIPPYIYRLYVY